MREIELLNDEFYHIYNRGLDKRIIFNDNFNFREFYQYLYLFSDSNYTNRRGDKVINMVELAGAEQLSINRNPYVKILAFNLLDNHFHLFVQQLLENGISKYLHKLQKTYSNKFNERQGRLGGLFESNFQAKHVNNDSHFLHIIRYIHLNSLDKQMPEWRQGKIKDWGKAMKILDNDPWSSHNVFMGHEQLYPIIDEEFARSAFNSTEDYVNYLKEWATLDEGLSEERDYWVIRKSWGEDMSKHIV